MTELERTERERNYFAQRVVELEDELALARTRISWLTLALAEKSPLHAVDEAQFSLLAFPGGREQ